MLIDDLTGALGGVDVTATVSGLDVAVEVDVGVPSFDPGDLLAIVQEIVPPDLADAIDTIARLTDGLAIEAVLEGGVVDGAIDTDALLAPLRARLDVLGRLAAPPLSDLDVATPELGLTGLQHRIELVAGGLRTGELDDLVGTLDGLVPGLDLTGTIDELGPTVGGVIALLQVLGGLLVHATVGARLQADAATVHRVLRGDVALAAAAQLTRLAGDTGLAAAITAADPEGRSLDTTLLPRVRNFATAVFELEATWRRSLGRAADASIGLDAEAAAAHLEVASRLVTGADLEAVGALAARIRGLLDGVVAAELPAPLDSIDDAVSRALELVGDLERVVTEVDVGTLVAPVGSVLERAIAPLSTVTDALQEVATTITSVLRSLEEAVRAVDLSPVTTAVERALDPVREALDAVTAIVADAEHAIAGVVTQLGDVLAEVRDAVETAAEVVRDALGAVESALAAVDFEVIQDTLDAGIGEVATALAAARLEPYFDATADAIDTTADVVDAVPFDLLPTDLQQEVVDAVLPIKQIDVAGFSEDLRAELRAIVDSLDTTVLEALDEAYQQIVAFLADLDPSTALAAFEEGPYAALRAAVDEVDPRSLLTPVEEALDGARRVVADVDLEGELLVPMRGAIDTVREALAGLAPAELLAPAVGEVDALREQVAAALQVDAAEDALDTARRVVAGMLARLDPGTVAGLLDGALVRALADEPATGPGLRDTVLVALTQASGLPADTGAVGDVVDWLAGGDPAAVTRQRLTTAAADLDAADTVVAQLDPAPLLAATRAHRSRLLVAARRHPEDSRLRIEIEAMLGGLDVDRTIGGLVAEHARARVAVRGAATMLATLTPSARTELVVARDGLLDGLRPITNLGAWLRQVLLRVGIEDADAPVSSLLRTLWTHIGPDRLLPPLVTLVTSMRDKAVEVLDALLGPLRGAVDDVQSAVGLLDLAPVVGAAVTVHDEVVAAVEAIDPVGVLGPVVADAQALLDELAGFDPLAPVTALIDDLEATIETTFETLRPTVLFADAFDIHQRLVELAGGLDVRGLLEPVLLALEDLVGQLDRGLEATAEALVALQVALPSTVSDSSVSGSVSVSIGVGS